MIDYTPEEIMKLHEAAESAERIRETWEARIAELEAALSAEKSRSKLRGDSLKSVSERAEQNTLLLRILTDAIERIRLVCECEGRPDKRHCWHMRDIAHEANLAVFRATRQAPQDTHQERKLDDIALCEQCCGATCKCGCHGEVASNDSRETK
jgi:hypothetical protein